MISIKDRRSKITLEELAPTPSPIPLDFLSRLPNILAAQDLKEIVLSVRKAREQERPVIFTFGAHVIKCGLTNIVTRLIEDRMITCLATNGASIVHDVELSLFGHTSEEVSAGLRAGTFGTTEETASFINNSINNLVPRGCGIGQAIGAALYAGTVKHQGIFRTCFRYGVPIYCHIALGTDIWHTWSNTDGEKIGQGSLYDFREFTQKVGELDNGGVILNFGSAVIMPEAILKAIAYHRAQEVEFKDIVMADFDMNRQYRPMTRIVETANLLGGRGYHITGHHELILPILGGLLLGE